MNTLKDIVGRLKEARALAKVNLEEVDPRFRSGVEGNVRNAARNIEDLEALYKGAVVKSLFVIGVKGPGSGEFARKAEDKVLCVDGNLVTNLLTKKITNRSSQTEFGGQELNMLQGELLELKSLYKIQSLPPIQDRGLSVDVAHLSIRDAIDRVLKQNFGQQLHSIAIRDHVANLALESLHDGPNLVAVVYNYGGVDESFLPAPVLTLDAKEGLSQEDTNAMLDKIRQSVTKLVYKTKPRGGKSANKEAQDGQQ
jgi:hypothetical protein